MELKIKSIICTALALIMTLSICACGRQPKEPDASSSTVDISVFEKNPEISESSAVEADESSESAATAIGVQKFTNDAGTSIDVLREEIGGTAAQFGVAYIGYFDSEVAGETGIDLSQWFSSAASPLNSYYPFVSEIDAAHTVGSDGDMFCIIAKDYEASVEVRDTGSDEVLYYAENGDPILILSNMDVVVTVTAADGSAYHWEPELDESGYPQLLIGDEREIIFMDFTCTEPLNSFDADSLLDEGWLGMSDIGLANDRYGLNWWFDSADGDSSYCLSFYLEENGNYDGEVLLECYDSDNTMCAHWQGYWRIETELDRPSIIYMDMEFIGGEGMASSEVPEIIAGSYWAMIHPSGESLLLAVEDFYAPLLPMLSYDMPTAEFSLDVY